MKVSTPGAPRPVYTVRLLGIDTPQASTECGGPDALHAMFGLSFPSPSDADGDGFFDTKGGMGARVRLTTDRGNPLFDENRDLLAYVDLAGDAPPAVVSLGAYDFGKTMIEGGLAPLATIDGSDFARADAYSRAEQAAMDARRGLWTKCGGDFDRPL